MKKLAAYALCFGCISRLCLFTCVAVEEGGIVACLWVWASYVYDVRESVQYRGFRR